MKEVIYCLTIAVTMTALSLHAQDDPVVAKVGEWKLTLAEFKKIMSYHDADQQKMFEMNPQSKAALLTRIVQGMVVAAKAKEQGFDKRDDVKALEKIAVNDFLLSEYIRKEVASKVTVTEEQVKAYYTEHPDEFLASGGVKVRHIFFTIDPGAGEAGVESAMERAQAALKRVREGEDFAKVADEVSEDKRTKGKGGNLGYVRKGRLGPEFDNVAFSLKAGEVSDVVRGKFGFHIIKVEERNVRFSEPFEKVSERIREKLLAETRRSRLTEFLDASMKEAHAEVNLEPLNIPEAPHAMPRGH